MVTEKQVMEVLKGVLDPELGVNIVDLGLIYGVKIERGKVFVKMTFTTPFCPIAQSLTREIEEKIKELKVKNVEVQVTFDPPWSPERMSKKAKKLLRF